MSELAGEQLGLDESSVSLEVDPSAAGTSETATVEVSPAAAAEEAGDGSGDEAMIEAFLEEDSADGDGDRIMASAASEEDGLDDGQEMDGEEESDAAGNEAIGTLRQLLAQFIQRRQQEANTASMNQEDSETSSEEEETGHYPNRLAQLYQARRRRHSERITTVKSSADPLLRMIHAKRERMAGSTRSKRRRSGSSKRQSSETKLPSQLDLTRMECYNELCLIVRSAYPRRYLARGKGRGGGASAEESESSAKPDESSLLKLSPTPPKLMGDSESGSTDGELSSVSPVAGDGTTRRRSSVSSRCKDGSSSTNTAGKKCGRLRRHSSSEAAGFDVAVTAVSESGGSACSPKGAGCVASSSLSSSLVTTSELGGIVDSECKEAATHLTRELTPDQSTGSVAIPAGAQRGFYYPTNMHDFLNLSEQLDLGSSLRQRSSMPNFHCAFSRTFESDGYLSAANKMRGHVLSSAADYSGPLDTAYVEQPHRRWQSESRVFCCDFSPDGSMLCCATQDHVIHLIDSSSTDTQDWAIYKQVEAEFSGWSIIDVALSPDLKWVCYSGWDDNVAMANVTGDRELHTLHNVHPPVSGPWGRCCLFGIEFDPTSTRILCGISSGCLIIHNLERDTNELCIADAHSDDINQATWIDHNVCVTGSDDALVKVWDRRVGSKKADCSVGGFVGHFQGITCVSSAQGKYILSNGKDSKLKLWDLRLASSEHELKDALSKLNHLTRGFDYRYGDWRSGEYDNRRHPKDSSLLTYTGHRVSRTLIRSNFSPFETTANRYVYTGGADGSVKVYETLTGEVVGEIGSNAHGAIIRDCSWHPRASSPMIASSGWDGLVCVWPVAEPRPNEGLMIPPNRLKYHGKVATTAASATLSSPLIGMDEEDLKLDSSSGLSRQESAMFLSKAGLDGYDSDVSIKSDWRGKEDCLEFFTPKRGILSKQLTTDRLATNLDMPPDRRRYNRGNWY